MKNALKAGFAALAGIALAVTPIQAFAEEAANTNTPVSTAAAATTTTAGTFASFDDRNRSIQFVQAGASEASRDKIAIIVWGGNREMQREAYIAARGLSAEGTDLALILGPPLGTGDRAVNIQVYARSVPVFEGSGALIGQNHTDQIAPTVQRMGRTAQARHFGSDEIATLSLR